MSKIAVVFWSGSGNTETMANLVADGARGAGADVDIIGAADFGAGDVDAYDALAFGCPAMGAEVLEEDEFEPMYDAAEPALGARKVGLFGSYGWGSGEWMDTWKARAEAAGVNVVGTVIANYEPDAEAEEACKALGAALA